MWQLESRVVVDTNILFFALLSSQSRFTNILLTSGHQFYVCELVVVELFKHKEKFVRLIKLGKMMLYYAIPIPIMEVRMKLEDRIL